MSFKHEEKAQWFWVKQVSVGTTERKEGIIYNVVEDLSKSQSVFKSQQAV